MIVSLMFLPSALSAQSNGVSEFVGTSLGSSVAFPVALQFRSNVHHEQIADRFSISGLGSDSTHARRRFTARGAAIGAGAGFLTGAVAGTFLSTGCDTVTGSTCSATKNRVGLSLVTATAGAVVGAGIGAVVGALTTKY